MQDKKDAPKGGETLQHLQRIVRKGKKRRNLQKFNADSYNRNIKNSTGSTTAGTDKLTINDIKNLTVDEVVEKIRYVLNGTSTVTAQNQLGASSYLSQTAQGGIISPLLANIVLNELDHWVVSN